MPRIERPAMTDYGVPDTLEGALEWSWASERLVQSQNYWVTTVDSQHKPHSTPVWGLWDADAERFWFSCAASSLKARNIAGNPNVVVAADNTVEVVSVEGVAVSGADCSEAERAAAAGAWGSKYANAETTAEEFATFFLEGTSFVIKPVKAFGLIETPEDFGPRSTRWVW